MDQTNSNSSNRVTKELRKETLSIYNRLRSIDDDAEFVKYASQNLFPQYPVLANERCGLWYVDPKIAYAQTVYFKSTDGHCGNWKFSLRRANTHLFDIFQCYKGCVIVDSTRSGKSMPDSFARTIPIWCAIWNIALARVKSRNNDQLVWDGAVHMPHKIVSDSERSQVSELLSSFADVLMRSDIDVAGLADKINKPLRPIWVTRDHRLAFPPDFTDAEFIPIVCVSASSTKHHAYGSDADFVYVQGAADDHEKWAKELTPRLFWKHKARLLCEGSTNNSCESAVCEIAEVEKRKQKTGVAAVDAQTNIGEEYSAAGNARFNFIAGTCIAVGDRVSGRPPECWKQFDAIINCGAPEYEQNSKDQALKSRYIYLPIPEGKRGQVELGKRIPWALDFVHPFIKGGNNKKVLVHCSQGMDRSVGIALAILAKFYDGDRNYNKNTESDISKESIQNRLLWITTSRQKASCTYNAQHRIQVSGIC
ncbi:tRNA A64-2'-O-ribosylphosphate transferase [Coemansia spiralis]|uniref:tRNA A64-2'-O-ribosylphosphate transferase n=2 Tax=Coemansia TaxID=4863 RepID=A0A9W8G4B0_9FUNG|nr:tRNA A64-2'-O-ribosylphosphate transferase [Coemansia umbellata]KAJ2621423.1 tRNA A64-2'-O-ribosylphosphate transferase [Coemansia sp. RSA 1358]KAJ2674398.1 tRNA A64-2'-O-ribosylphosphate transferase [Coemansia spiralis]